jgi:hypothetical protein
MQAVAQKRMTRESEGGSTVEVNPIDVQQIPIYQGDGSSGGNRSGSAGFWRGLPAQRFYWHCLVSFRRALGTPFKPPLDFSS